MPFICPLRASNGFFDTFIVRGKNKPANRIISSRDLPFPQDASKLRHPAIRTGRNSASPPHPVRTSRSRSCPRTRNTRSPRRTAARRNGGEGPPLRCLLYGFREKPQRSCLTPARPNRTLVNAGTRLETIHAISRIRRVHPFPRMITAGNSLFVNATFINVLLHVKSFSSFMLQSYNIKT